jgi:hypothetical protein
MGSPPRDEPQGVCQVEIVLFLGVPVVLVRKEKEKPYLYTKVLKGYPEI